MIFNNRKNGSPVPKVLEDAEEKLQEIINTRNYNLISPSIYKGTKTINGVLIHRIRDLLRAYYHNKCAYCETKEHKPEIEHYRPKKSVKEDGSHPGYYWLCYEWSNLLPSCRYCNTEGGKGTKFPILGSRRTAPSLDPSGKLIKACCHVAHPHLSDELPVLLHPEIDDPKPYFKFLTNGSIVGIDGAGRGEGTIEICNLRRDNLKYRRQQLIDAFVDRIDDVLLLYKNGRRDARAVKEDLFNIFKSMDRRKHPTQEFSLLGQYLLEHFNSTIVKLVAMKFNVTDKDRCKRIVAMAYIAYRVENQN